MGDLNDLLDQPVRKRLKNLDKETCRDWGGYWYNDTAHVRPLFPDTEYTTKTVVRSEQDALDAFARYNRYFLYVLNYFQPSHSEAVILPCGSSKPIGSSTIHQKKLDAIAAAGFDQHDILIMSEPAVIIPHDERLTLPAVNYDFPPKWTEQETAPAVFELFAQRLALFLDQKGYDRVFTYLVSRHQQKFDRAMELTRADTQMVRVPGASYNPESGAYCGDRFQTTENMTQKLLAVRGNHEAISPECWNFYADRSEYPIESSGT